MATLGSAQEQAMGALGAGRCVCQARNRRIGGSPVLGSRACTPAHWAVCLAECVAMKHLVPSLHRQCWQ